MHLDTTTHVSLSTLVFSQTFALARPAQPRAPAARWSEGRVRRGARAASSSTFGAARRGAGRRAYSTHQHPPSEARAALSDARKRRVRGGGGPHQGRAGGSKPYAGVVALPQGGSVRARRPSSARECLSVAQQTAEKQGKS